MVFYSIHQALVAAGSANSDPILLQDQCLEDWLQGKRYLIVTVDSKDVLTSYESQDIEIVIYKEKRNDTT